MKAVLLAPVAAVLLLAAACGGDGDVAPDGAGFEQEPGATREVESATSTTAGLEPMINGSNPASFSIIEEDLNGGWITDNDHTYVRGPADYQAFGASSGGRLFESPDEAKATLAEWGYQGGYTTGFDPVGLTAAVLRGQFYIDLELHLFGSIEGAQAAFAHFSSFRGSAEGAEEITSIDAVGNEHAAYRLVSGTVTGSDIPAIFHLYIFRRGNMVGIVQTGGAEPYMTDAAVATLASIVDEKVLGTRTSPTPTPVQHVTVPPTLTPAP